MKYIIGILRETFKGEKRVALCPGDVFILSKKGFTILVENGAGENAFFSNEEYVKAGAKITEKDEIYEKSNIFLFVRAGGADPDNWHEKRKKIREGSIIVGFLDPFSDAKISMDMAEKKFIPFAMELIPRVARAQSMDALTSMAMLSGYRAVLIAGELLPRIFPFTITAAGTLPPARVFVLGAGVAGLHAISTAKRLGAQVTAYDIRESAKDEVESLGGRFLTIPFTLNDAEDEHGYARSLSEELYKKQREFLLEALKESDAVITTALTRERKAPRLITEEMVREMKPGSVIVDIAAEKGGNCTLTEPGKVIIKYGVKIAGPVNLPSEVSHHASLLYSRNITNFLLNLISEKGIRWDDEIVQATFLTKRGRNE